MKQSFKTEKKFMRDIRGFTGIILDKVEEDTIEIMCW